MSAPKIVAIIPARGGSKGIPKKNIVPLLGKPLIHYTIEAALNADKIDKVYVSTDCDEIAQSSTTAGAEIIHRPDDIAGDIASSEDAILHALKTIDASEGAKPELVVFLQCTSPFTTSEDIDSTIGAMQGANAQSAFAACDFHYFVWQIDNSGEAVGINHDKSHRPMRQQREQQLLEAGSVYVMEVEGFIKEKHRFFGKTVTHIIPTDRVFEIDDPEDLVIAEAILKSK